MRFDRFGLAFDYPENWALDVDGGDGQSAVSVHSPDGGFWSVSAHAPDGPPAALATAVVQEMRAQYAELDSEPVVDEVGGRLLAGFDMNFYCLDLTNTARVRTLATPAAVYLILCQAEDRDWERTAPVFAAITTSFVAGLGADGGAGPAR